MINNKSNLFMKENIVTKHNLKSTTIVVPLQRLLTPQDIARYVEMDRFYVFCS
jgi:hypothetical protein